VTVAELTPQDIERLRALPPEQKEQLRAQLTQALEDSERNEAEWRERVRVFDEKQRVEAEARKAEFEAEREAAEEARKIVARGKAKAASIRKGITS
jgi:hypothetical protein